MKTPSVDWFALSPILAPLAASGLALLGAVLAPRGSRKGFAAFTAALGFVTAIGLGVWLYIETEVSRGVIADAIVRDRYAIVAQIIIAVAGLLTVGVAWGERREDPHWGEYFSLLAAAGAGMAFFVAANNLMVLFLGLEWFSICLYILCAIHAERASSLEAGLKYLIVGSFGSAVLLFGSALVYGSTGELTFGRIADAANNDVLLLAGLAMVLAGLGFKASAAPFHMWTPDVYEGAPTPVTGFMAAATKVAALVLTFRVLVTAFPEQSDLWTYAVAAMAVASLAIGNLAALVQRNVKRILAYSSVSHAGFLLIPIAANNELGARALLFYLVPYAAVSVGAFAVIAARERELRQPVTLDNLSGFGWERPFLGVAMAIFAFGLIGLPPAGLFAGKFYALAAAADRDWWWLVVVGVIATVISVYYYLAIIGAMYFRSRAELQLMPAGGSPPPERLLQTTVAVAVAVTVASFVLVRPLIDLARDATEALPL